MVCAQTRGREVFALEADGARLDLAQAGQSLYELGLTVAAHAGDRHDLATAHIERDALDRLETALVHDVQILDSRARSLRRQRSASSRL